MRSRIAVNVLAWLDAAWRGHLKHAVRAVLASCFGLTLMLSCYKAPTISQASASDLSVLIQILDHTPTASKAKISVGFSKGDQVVALSGNLSMACEGVVFPPVQVGSSQSLITVPRQPDGGVYHCIYTDENGKKTSLAIPTPQGKGQIISPAPGATVHLTEPLYNSTSKSRPAGQVTAVTIRYTLPTPPAGARALARAVAYCGPAYDCVAVSGDEVPATGTYVLTDAHLPYGSGFETFPIGWHSEILLFLRFEWFPSATGFQKVHVIYAGAPLVTDVTWSRS